MSSLSIRLNDLPPEVFDVILRKCGDRSLVRLGLTGANLQNRKPIYEIIEPYLVNLSGNELSSTQALRYLQRNFEKIEGFYHYGPLTRESLYSKLDEQHAQNLPLMLTQLNLCSRITHICLLSSFYRWFSSKAYNPSLQENLPDLPLSLRSFETNIFSVFANYMQRLPNELTSLKVYSIYRHNDEAIFKNTPLFPATLTSLNMSDVRFPQDTNWCFGLPSELEVLKINDVHPSVVDDKLISGLTKLKTLALHIQHQITKKGLKCLPLSLTNLKIQKNKQEIDGVDESDMAVLPASITNLTTIGFLRTPGLPSSLTKLTISTNSESPLKEDIEHLENLTYLNLWGSDLGHDFYMLKWPKKLTSLTIDDRMMNFDDLQLLPRTLKFLDMNHCKRNRKISEHQIKYLPESLTKLSLGDSYVTDEMIAFLPKTITSLDLYFCKGLTDDSSKKLPNELTYLDISCCKHITDVFLTHVPKTLTSINAHNTAITLLPSNIKQVLL